jgi:hypothetical protein
MKKTKIIFFSLVSLILIAISAFLFLIFSNKKENEPTISDHTQITPAPTQVAEPTSNPQTKTELYPAYLMVNKELKYGYINKTGEFVIPPSFDTASYFHDGAAVVTCDGKYCVIDDRGNVLFTNDYSINEFSNGAAVYSTKKGNDQYQYLYGYVDVKGEIILEPQFIMATDFNSENTAYVSTAKGSYALIDKTGKTLETYQLEVKNKTIWSLQDDYVIYSYSDSANYGVVTVKGEEVLKASYPEIRYLGNHLFAVKDPGVDGPEASITAKEAIFNQKGEQLTDYIYYDLSNYYEGYASATDDSSTFFIDPEGKVVEKLPRFDGRGTLKLFGDVISAYLDEEQLYTDTSKSTIWKAEDTYALSDTLSVKKIKLKPNRYVLVNYPQLEGFKDVKVQDKINTELKRRFTENRANITVGDSLSVNDSFSLNLLENLLIIGRDGYDYYFGAAHGMPLMDYYYIDLNTGMFYQLKDLFKADSDYRTKINDMILSKMAAQTESGEFYYFPDSFVGITEDQRFKLEQDAITIYFYPYDIAAYAAGFPEFVIPFADIADEIDTSGAFWNSFQP